MGFLGIVIIKGVVNNVIIVKSIVVIVSSE